MTTIEETAGRDGALRRGRGAGWAAVGALAAATFTVVTSEMLPVGLLTPIGGALGVTDGTAGLTLTVTGVVAAVGAPVLTLAVGRADRRRVLCGLLAMLAAANLLAAWAPDFGVMVVARVLVGVGMGGVWALAAGLAVRLVEARSVAAATSLIFSGVAVASVLGVPAGTLIGQFGGWRAAFAVVAALSALVAVALAMLLPPLPAEGAVRLDGVLRLFRDARVRTGLIVVALLVGGHFAAYTYVRPVLEEVSGVGPGVISTLLLVYGAAGVAGNFVGGVGAGRSPRGTLLVISGVLAGAVLLVPLLGVGVPGAVALLAVWGLAYGGVSVSTQTWLMAVAPRAREAASALFVGVFNAAIALGAFGGGRAVDGWGLTGVLWLGGALAAGALVAVAAGRGPGAVSR
ncbi:MULTISPECIES: MFS transporter [Streptomyces]|uniref:MFS transporter n=4 Tax=Streptomyces TaxID=1883 RepID=L8F1J2_STRR1|nr:MULTISPECIES: MFS transporter [Streptomyces]MYT46998.1 MFS transporter [Streptomyces sp. SID5471]QDA09676.1 MFS transporter [Streptomyces rimosus]QEV80946.1 MFS transporter [Streptomyces rimosus]QGY65369.1 MFS transporter [Streptomyces rimosus R6-500]QST82296.1 MFS transporter [Streptomyces rimosus subsp. rimosus ATCC 10970]